MLSSKELQLINDLELFARRNISAALAGCYVSAYRGLGLEFEEVRAYEPGDDVRLIHWPASARSQIPLLKVMREERDLEVFAVIDASKSMFVGPGERTKFHSAARLAAVVGHLATQSHDAFGFLGVAANGGDVEVPARKGAKHLARVFAGMAGVGAGQGFSWQHIGRALARAAKRRALVFVMSDFLDDDSEDDRNTLRVLARRHQIVLLRVRNAFEMQPQTFSDVGVLALESADGKVAARRSYADYGSRGKLSSIAARLKAHDLAHEDFWRGLGLAFCTLGTDQEMMRGFAAFLRSMRFRR